MVTDQTNPARLFRALRNQISINGLRSFKVLKLRDSENCQNSQFSSPVRHNRRFTDSQLVTHIPEQ